MSVADGESRRMAYPRGVSSQQSCSTFTLMTSHDGTRNFIYADDICVTAQYSSFTEVETTIGDALEELTHYYRSNSLRANPDKTQVTAFRLRNKEANRSLKVEWNRTKLENTPHPKYLGVTLDPTRNNLLRKLSNSKWGANASTIRTTALALCYSVAEYAAPVQRYSKEMRGEMENTSLMTRRRRRRIKISIIIILVYGDFEHTSQPNRNNASEMFVF